MSQAPMPTAPGVALEVCVALTALPPPTCVAQYIAAGHARIAEPLGATGGFVALGARCRPPERDPLSGWRISMFYSAGRREHRSWEASEQVISEESYVDDPVVQHVMRDAGQHRVYHDPDPRLDPARRGTLDGRFWELEQLVDRLKFVFAVSESIEVHMSVDRHAGNSGFDSADREFVHHIMRGLGPWARRIALLHGMLDGNTRLSPRERDIACGLLGHEQLKVIADELGMSEARAREIVREVYRKLRIGSRAELSRLWSGEHCAEPERTIVMSTGRLGSSVRPPPRER